MRAPDDTPRNPRMRPALRVLLFVSLALNLAVLGVVAGATLFDRERDGGRHFERIGGPLTMAFDHEERQEMAQQMRQRLEDSRPDLDAMRVEYQATLQALRSDPFDPTSIKESFARQLDYSLERQRLGQQLVLDRLRAMTPAERAAFAGRLEDGVRRHRERAERHRNSDG